jgi:hypothetical protein
MRFLLRSRSGLGFGILDFNVGAKSGLAAIIGAPAYFCQVNDLAEK